jgi:hypothetical protein
MAAAWPRDDHEQSTQEIEKTKKNRAHYAGTREGQKKIHGPIKLLCDAPLFPFEAASTAFGSDLIGNNGRELS